MQVSYLRCAEMLKLSISNTVRKPC